MNTKLAVTVALLAILTIGFIGQVFAQTRFPGVQANDYYNYSVVARWTSDNATATIPQDLLDLNKTTEYKISIGGVLDVVNFTSTHIWKLSDGTEHDYLIEIDVQSGTPYYLTGSRPPLAETAVGKNLNAGDLLHPSGNDSLTINQTIIKDYAGGSRSTNIVELNGPIQNETTDSNNQTILQTIGYQDITYYLDRETGIIVGLNSTVESIVPIHEMASEVWTLTSTNRWDASPAIGWLAPAIIAVVVVVAVVLAAIVIFKPFKKGRKRRR